MSDKKQSSVDYFFEEVVKWEMRPWLYASDGGLEGIYEKAKEMRKEEIKNAQMDMYNHVNDLSYGLSYFAQLQKAEEFADNYCNETFGGGE